MVKKSISKKIKKRKSSVKRLTKSLGKIKTRVKKLSQRSPLRIRRNAKSVKRNNKSAARRPIVFLSEQSLNPLRLEDFLVDEQNFYSTNPLIDKVIKENTESSFLNQSRDFEARPSNKDLIPENEIKLYLNEQGKIDKLEKTYQQQNSAHLLDLKNKQEVNFKSDLTTASDQASFSKNHNRTNFSSKPISFIKKENFIEKLDRQGEKIYHWSARLFSAKRKISPKQSFELPIFSKLDGFDRLLINLKYSLNFALLALLLILPIKGAYFYENLVKTKGQVLGISLTAWQDIKQGALAAGEEDWQQAILNFNSANNSFSQALVMVEQYNQLLINIVKVIPATGKKLNSAENLLIAGKHLTFAAQNLSEVFNQSQSLNDQPATLTQKLALIQQALNIVKEDLNQAINYLVKVDPSIVPTEESEYLRVLQEQLPSLKENLQKSDKLLSLALEILGHQNSKRFLFIFQNTNELRPTGGFFGSFALVDIKDGQIVKIESPGGGPYDLKGYFTEKIISPQPLHLVGTAWEIWDANWWPDFPTSAKKIAWFFEKSEWPTVDGVIAFNSSLLPELLKIVGNIELPEYNKVLTPDDVVLALQHATLFEYDKSENKPKQIISDLMPILVSRLLEIKDDQTLPLLLTLNQALKQKEIQFYFAKSEIQLLASQYNLTGEVLATNKDFLMVVDTNIAGGKTNGVIEQQINHYAQVQPDGSIIDNLAVTRIHHGDQNDVFERVNNVSYLRIYVPLNSQLIDVTGYQPPDQELFKKVYPDYQQDEYLERIQGKEIVDQQTGTRINNELGKTVFGNWIQVEPGQSSTITFSYRLPFKLSKISNGLFKTASLNLNTYSLLIQNQSGAKNVKVKSSLTLANDLTINWGDATSGSQLTFSENKADFSGSLENDQFYALVVK